MTLPISYFRFYFPEYVLKSRLPPNCATGFFDRLRQVSHGRHLPVYTNSRRILCITIESIEITALWMFSALSEFTLQE